MMRCFHAASAAAVITLASVAGASSGATKQMAEATTTRPERNSFAIIYRAGPAWRPGVPMEQQGLRDHFFYLRALDKNDRIIIAGPIGPEGGLLLISAHDQAEADSVVAADPAVVAGLFVGAAMPFTPRFVGREPLAPVRP